MCVEEEQRYEPEMCGIFRNASVPRPNCGKPPTNWPAPTLTCNSSPTSPRTTCKSRCGPWRGACKSSKRRCKHQLDARADELIGHAVDGVRRMQTLINDLLAYSRVGTRGKGFEPTGANAVLKAALANLSASVTETGAVVTHDELPTVMADGAINFARLFCPVIP